MYATRPPATTLRYALAQSGVASAGAGSAELEWRRDAAGYTLRLATATAGRPPREWQSTGAFDAAGVAPLRWWSASADATGAASPSTATPAACTSPVRRTRRSAARRSLELDRAARSRGPAEAGVGRATRPEARARARAGRPRLPTSELQVAGCAGDLGRLAFQVAAAGQRPNCKVPICQPGIGLPA